MEAKLDYELRINGLEGKGNQISQYLVSSRVLKVL